jgi:isoleucyl-tRNA synthetase
MFVIADGLTRLLAPILPTTADELWRHLPGAPDPSVHLALFPTDVSAFVDRDLISRWERLMKIRDDVNRALETERQAKTIGNSLGARVILRASGDDARLLDKYRDDLPMLFIVSQVELQTGGGDGPTEITVARAEGEKCARCWRTVPTVAADGPTAGLCDRCVDALPETTGPVAA